MSNVEEAFQIITKNIAEPLEKFLLTREDLVKLLSEKKSGKSYVGFEPSGPIHIGYFPVIEKMKDLNKAGFQTTALLADLHALLNRKGPADLIREVAETYWIETFEHLGVEAKYIMGSSYQLSKDYVFDLYVLSEKVRAKEAWKAMSIIAREAEDPTVSQYIYPLMQALDILYLGADIAFGGTDQLKVHVLARTVFAESDLKLTHEVWVPVALHMPIIIGLTGKKMSSSKPKTHIATFDKPKTIMKKMRNAYCPPDQVDPEVNPIFSFLKHIIMPYETSLTVERPEKYGGDVTYKSYGEIVEDYLAGKLHALDLKNSIANYFIKKLEPVRKRYEEDPDILRSVYKLQKWQWEKGYISRDAWEALEREYMNYFK
ncbi:MAG: tyrosine--tRNA ligase [Candidatus Njordarchaeia archaeon]